MWGNSLIGGIGDQIGLIVWGQISNIPFTISSESLRNFHIYRDIFDTQLYPWFSSQPVLWTFMSFFLSLFGPNFFNVWLLITLFLNLYFSYRLFKRFKYSWFYIIVFNFSSYFWIHFGEHIALSQTWMYCFLFELLLNRVWMKSPLKFSLWLVLFSLISNYIGFFSFVYFIIYTFLYSCFNKHKTSLQKSFIPIIKTIFLYVIFLGISIYPYIKANYINPFENLNEVGSKSMRRSLSDYVTFSSRPWYFLIPSTHNPIFGNVSSFIYDSISSTGNYLSDDYFVYEHSSNYFGWGLIIFCVWLLFKSNVANSPNKQEIKVLTLCSIIVFIIIMPPIITFKGINFYNIGFLLYKLAPFFRVSSRMSVVIHLSLLVSMAYMIGNLKIRPIYMYLLSIIILVETYIPLRVTELVVPDVYKYIGNTFNSNDRIVVYPYSSTQGAFLWLPVHKQLVVNLRGYVRGDFSSEKFTLSLYKDPKDIYQKLLDLDVKYIVDFDSSTYSTMDTDKFNIVKSFQDSVLYEVIR